MRYSDFQKCKNWFNNYTRSTTSSSGRKKDGKKACKCPKFWKSYTLQDGVKELHSDRIKAKVKESTDKKWGLVAWLAIYAKAAAEVAAQLSAKERKDVNDLVERWNTQGPSKEEKKKWVYFSSRMVFIFWFTAFKGTWRQLGPQ